MRMRERVFRRREVERREVQSKRLHSPTDERLVRGKRLGQAVEPVRPAEEDRELGEPCFGGAVHTGHDVRVEDGAEDVVRVVGERDGARDEVAEAWREEGGRGEGEVDD